MDEDKIVINKEGRTYTAYEKLKKIWSGVTLGAFSRRWLGRRRTENNNINKN